MKKIFFISLILAAPLAQAQGVIQSDLFPPSETTQAETEAQTTQPQERPKKEGCLDTTALNYDTSADIHREIMCIYPIVNNNEEIAPPHQPQDITGFFEVAQVQSGATTWNMTLNINTEGATLNYEKIQSWNRFTPISATTEGKKITITFRQYDDQRLSVDCNNYEITIPRGAIFTGNGDDNRNPISGNFTVIGCQEQTELGDIINKNTVNDETQLNIESTYLPILVQKDGFLYIDIKGLSLGLFYILLSFSFFYVIFRFFYQKN